MEQTKTHNTLLEPAREIPVIHEADVCVLGGSCTGLFAAIRAARLGARVVIVEKENCFGGIATTGLVNVWHSLWDTEGHKQIIAGLTHETIKRLDKRGVVRHFEKTDAAHGVDFNSEELKIELDVMAKEAGLKIYFHTVFCAPYVKDGRLEGVLVENKSGRGAIKARTFVDATGDGDLAVRLGCPSYRTNPAQPSTTCARFAGWSTLGKYAETYASAIREHGAQFGLPDGFAWGDPIPGSHDVFMLAGTRVALHDCSNADELTQAEIEGRRQVRAIQDLLKHFAPESRFSLETLASRIGVRESRHIKCDYQLTGNDLLSGRSFPDTIALGSYRVDVHHQDKQGITFRYLDGTELYVCQGLPTVKGRWRPKTEVNPTYYQIPLRSMLPGGYPNLVVAGRMIDADPVAHGAIRVMVNCNQMGEAAGVAAWMAAESGSAIRDLDVKQLRRTLVAGGSVIC